MKRMTTTHKASIALSLVAFGLFVANQFKALSGSSLDLHGATGAALLTGFLAAGILVQFGKFIEGHASAVELAFTSVLLVAHVAAEMAIWWRTQIAQIALPVNLPLYIVGLYWLVGALDLLTMYVPANLRALSPGYVSPEERLAEVERSRALSEQQASNLKDTITDLRGTIEQQRDTIEQSQRDLRDAIEDANKMHSWTCPACGKYLEHDNRGSLDRARKVHLAQWCKGESAVAANGHKQVAADERAL